MNVVVTGVSHKPERRVITQVSVGQKERSFREVVEAETVLLLPYQHSFEPTDISTGAIALS